MRQLPFIPRLGNCQRNEPCALMEPPVMLNVMSRRPGLSPSIFPGVVCSCQLPPGAPSGWNSTCLGILATLEEGSHANKTNVVIPHDCVASLLPWHPEFILKNCRRNVSSSTERLKSECYAHLRNSPSRFSGRNPSCRCCMGSADKIL